MHFNIGREVKDRVTGFEGIATGHVEYITGCNQTRVQPRVGETGKIPDAEWIDDSRLMVDLNADARLVLEGSEAENGADGLAPPIR